MHVVNVLGGDKRVQRGIDGAGPWVKVECGVRVHTDQIVLDLGFDPFDLGPIVNGLQRQQFVHVQRGKIGSCGCPQVAAGTFDPEDLNFLIAERVGHHYLGRRVAAARVGDPLIGTQNIGAVAQTFNRIKLVRDGVIPAVGYVFELVLCHVYLYIVIDDEAAPDLL